MDDETEARMQARAEQAARDAPRAGPETIAMLRRIIHQTPPPTLAEIERFHERHRRTDETTEGQGR